MVAKTVEELLGKRTFKWYDNLDLLSETMKTGYMRFRKKEDVQKTVQEYYAAKTAFNGTFGIEDYCKRYISILEMPHSDFIDLVLTERLKGEEKMTLATLRTRLKTQNIYIAKEGQKTILVSSNSTNKYDDSIVRAVKMTRYGVLCIEVK